MLRKETFSDQDYKKGPKEPPIKALEMEWASQSPHFLATNNYRSLIYTNNKIKSEFYKKKLATIS